MSGERDLQNLIAQLPQQISEVASNDNIDNEALRRILSLIGEAVESFELLYRGIYDSMLKISTLDTTHLKEISNSYERWRETVGSITYHRFNSSESLYHKLSNLKDEFENLVGPRLTGIKLIEDWKVLFNDIVDIRGNIILDSEEFLYGVSHDLKIGFSETRINLYKERAFILSKEIKRNIDNLRTVRGRIFGISGERGFLELTKSNRSLIPEQVQTLVINQDLSRTEGDRYVVQGTHISNTGSNPWISGSFYLSAIAILITLFLVVGRSVSIVVLPAIIIGSILAVSTIGAFQLRQDNSLSEKGFLSLMGLTLKYLPFMRNREKAKDSNLPNTK